MKYFQRFFTILFTISALAVVTVRSFAQSQCSGRIYGIPICTGFCVAIDTSSVHKRINKLEQSADSLREEGSLHLPNPIVPYLDIDPQYINPGNNYPYQWPIDPTTPDEFYEPGIPNSPFYYIPPNNIERMPSPLIEPFKKEKKSNPIRDFKGWNFEKLADQSGVK